MATFFMFGEYSAEAIKDISSKRTEKAAAVIKELGGELKSAHILLGKPDLVAVVELPGTEAAVKASLALSKLTGIAFETHPAVSAEDFDKLAEGM